jgi:hypothetical protein
VVVAWSTTSTKSEWVGEEAAVGKKRGVLVPVLLDHVEPPFGFTARQALDLTSLEPERLDRLAAAIIPLAGPASKRPDLDKFARLPRSLIAAAGFLAVDCALALYAIRVGCGFFVPLGQYLLSPAAWLPPAALLVLAAPPVRSGLQALLKKLRTARLRVRMGLVAALGAVGLLLGAAAWASRPSLELRLVDRDIDSGDSSQPPFSEIRGASIDATSLCDGSASSPTCDAPLPSSGHLQVLIHLGLNRLRSYRLELEGGDSPSVSFARVRVTPSLAAAVADAPPLSQGRVLQIAGGGLRTELTGTVDVRLRCRKVPKDAPGEPKLRLRLVPLLEGKDDEHGISKCWTLGEGRVGGPCPAGSR